MTTADASAMSGGAQQAFLGLLARPMVTPVTDPELHRRVVRNIPQVADRARRLGYRLASVGRTVRLVRVPAAGMVTAPERPVDAPGRRVLALTCVLAAVCEESIGGATLAKLSGLVEHLTAGENSPVTAYEQRLQAHRRQLLRAVALLEHWGVLRRRTADDRLLEEWADGGSGIGAGYDVDRDALLLMTSPEVLAAALEPGEPDPEQLAATRARRALRALVETPAVVYGDLDLADAEALRSTRGLRAREAAELTGGHIEARAEGLVLVLPDEPPSPTVEDWPRPKAESWVALLMLDRAGRMGQRRPDGAVVLSDDDVHLLAVGLEAERRESLVAGLRDDPARIRVVAENQLRSLGLLQLAPEGGWVVSPVAGRYRDPTVRLARAGTEPDPLVDEPR